MWRIVGGKAIEWFSFVFVIATYVATLRQVSVSPHSLHCMVFLLPSLLKMMVLLELYIPGSSENAPVDADATVCLLFSLSPKTHTGRRGRMFCLHIQEQTSEADLLRRLSVPRLRDVIVCILVVNPPNFASYLFRSPSLSFGIAAVSDDERRCWRLRFRLKSSVSLLLLSY
jgi:hypothetical protein